MHMDFDPQCRQCPRLAVFLGKVRNEYPDYHAAPVPAFGDRSPRLLIIGLAPGLHGANRTGRPFTGDYAGLLLYQSLFDLGLSNMPHSEHASDELRLSGVRITNAVKCLPPQNKPNTEEVRCCNSFLATEIKALPPSCKLLALGSIAHQAVLRAYDLKLSFCRFGHGAIHELPDGRKLVNSYHCSRYNTQTKRLTRTMFIEALQKAL